MSDFLAEARVLIRPDTTAFRAALVAELAAVTKGVSVPVPVTPVVQATAATATTAAVTQQLTQQAAAAQALGAQQQKAASATTTLTAAQNAQAAAAKRLAVSQAEVIGSSSAVAAAQVTLSRSSAAVVAGERAVELSVRSADAALIQAAEHTLGLAKAQQTQAAAGLAQARANAGSAASLGSVQTAALASSAGMLGLRGAVLTASAAFLGATVAFQAFGKSVGLAIDFERELNVFQATAEATASEMNRASDAARELGRDITLPGISAGDAAQTMTLLAKAGLDVQESLDATRGTLQLATAAQIENADAAELVANALNSFLLPGKEAARVADLLAAASNESQGSILDMGIALRQVSPVAKLVNLSVEDTVTILTQLARSGLSASDAGTSFRQALLRLIQDMPKVNREVEKLGLDLRDAQGQLRPEVFGELQHALQGLSPAARQASIAALGGSDAIRTFGLLAQDGADAFEEMQQKLTRGGDAAKLAQAATKGLGGDIEALKNNSEALGLTLGQLASPVLSSVVGGLNLTLGGVNSLVDGFRRLVDPPQEAATSVAGLRRELADATANLDEFRDKIGDTATGADLIVLESLKQEVNELSVALDRKLVEAAKRSTDGMTAWVKVMKDAAAAAKVTAEAISGPLTASMIQGQTQAQQTAVANARAFGEKGLQELIDLRDRIDVILEGPRRPTGPALETLLNQRAATIASIEAIFQQNAQDKQAAADRIAKAQDAADQAFVDKVERGASKRANRLLIAEGTKSLADDIATQRSIRQFYKDRIAEVKRTVDDAKLAARLIVQFTKEVVTAEQAIATAKTEQANRRKDAKEERERLAREAAETRTAKIDLDIELAETTENETAEVAARNRKIKDLQRQLAAEASAHGKNTLLYKQIRNEIASEKAALDDLRKEQDDATNSARSFRQATFDFLQAQQGFAANLLGNLIPSSATAGLVGGAGLAQPVGASAPPPGTGVVPIDFGLRAEADVVGAKQTGGVTSGQAQTTNGLLNMIYRELVNLNASDKTPEATRQRKRSNAVMDGVGGG